MSTMVEQSNSNHRDDAPAEHDAGVDGCQMPASTEACVTFEQSISNYKYGACSEWNTITCNHLDLPMNSFGQCIGLR